MLLVYQVLWDSISTKTPLTNSLRNNGITRPGSFLRMCVCAQAFSHFPNPLEGQLDAKSHHSFNTSTATDTRLAWSSFAWFSPKQWIPQSLRTCVGTLHCDSSIWTQHTVQLMIIQSRVLSQGPSEHRACLPWYWSDCTSFIQVHF